MLIKDLIKQLEELYNSYDEEYKKVMGEPNICIDVFKQIGNTHTFKFEGISQNIVIEKSMDGVYDILSCFSDKNDS